MKHLVLALMIATPAFADEPPLPAPALYDVTGVAAGDVLNIRSVPDASGEIVGSLPPDAEAVEIVEYSRSSEWGLVGMGEVSGWVAMRYLTARPAEYGYGGLPAGLSCSGTEPFWTVRFTDAGLEIVTPDTIDAPETFAISDLPAEVEAPRDLNWGLLFHYDLHGEAAEARILPGRCSDGMSDRVYGYHYLDSKLGYGCCSLSQ